MIDKKTIIKNIPNAVSTVKVPGLGKKEKGKVRDWYSKNSFRVLITTDRISAFDRVVGTVPFRGAVLTKLSEFWFNNTRDIVQNHMIGVIDPNVMLVSECHALPVEVVVRGYITGVTDTSLWKSYSEGERVIYGIKFPDGLIKNQKLKKPIITPTTRATGKSGHDEPITKEQILKQKLVSPKNWKQIEKVALELFKRGTEIAEKSGFILADTKYEFGIDSRGKLTLIDEIHTPDSSRFWLKKNYKTRFKKSQEVESYDKEYMRIWLNEKNYSGKGKPPQMPKDLTANISTRYMEVYEKLTKENFLINLETPPIKRVSESLAKLI